MLDTTMVQARELSAGQDRRRPDSSAMQVMEALQATEVELMASNARLMSINQALDSARQREERLLEIIEKNQTRLQRVLFGTVAAVVAIAIALSLIVILILNTH